MNIYGRNGTRVSNYIRLDFQVIRFVEVPKIAVYSSEDFINRAKSRSTISNIRKGNDHWGLNLENMTNEQAIRRSIH